jgi:hypothetical protein
MDNRKVSYHSRALRIKRVERAYLLRISMLGFPKCARRKSSRRRFATNFF